MLMTKTKTKTPETKDPGIDNDVHFNDPCELATVPITDNPITSIANRTQASAKKRAVHEQIMKEYLAK